MFALLDTHQHLIYRDRIRYGWTRSFPALSSASFTLEDYARISDGAGIAATLFMETAADESDFHAETQLASTLAAELPNGVVGLIASIRPENDDGFEDWIAEAVALGAVGFRRVLHVVDDAVSQSPVFRRNVRRIGEVGKVFDICVLARQLPLAAELADACGDTQLVLDHCGTPDIAGGGLDPWRADMAELARRQNVVCKLSGLFAYCTPRSANLGAIRPYVDHVLETFGPTRMVWGSDWPVVNTTSDLTTWIAATRAILDGLRREEAEAIANGNAQALYKVRLPGV